MHICLPSVPEGNREGFAYCCITRVSITLPTYVPTLILHDKLNDETATASE